MPAYLVDTRDNRIGQLMAKCGAYYFLRPIGGGCEWTCPPERTRLATPAERLAAGVRAANAATRERGRLA